MIKSWLSMPVPVLTPSGFTITELRNVLAMLLWIDKNGK